MGVKQISVEEAQQAMTASDNVVYIDVRTPEEFLGGHPPKAVNIPVVLPSPGARQMAPNLEFMRVVEANVSKEKQVIVGCKMGGRSQIAADLMHSAGYSDVSNMRGGFAGEPDRMTGQIAVPGWIQLQLPVETEVSASNSYEALKQTLL